MTMSLMSATIVAAIALVAPLVIKLARIPLPAIVLQLLLGIAIGPQVLHWANVDEAVSVLSLIGLQFLLLLAGLEIAFDHLRGAVLRSTGIAFALSLTLAFGIGQALAALSLVNSGPFIAVVLSATSLGIIVPVLEDAQQAKTSFGQLVVAGGSIAEVIPIVLLSLLFSRRSGGIGSQLVLLIAFALFVGAVAIAIVGFERWKRVRQAVLSLHATTAEIRVRGAFLLVMLFAALATKFGLEAILGAFLAGATLKLVDRDMMSTHPLLYTKLHAAGFGVFIPYFFVATGMKLDVRTLVGSGSILARVPMFLAAILLVRATPALMYRKLVASPKHIAAAGLLQATSLSIPIVAGQVGVDLGLLRPDNYVALVAAGVLSVILFPLLASVLLGSPSKSPAPEASADQPAPRGEVGVPMQSITLKQGRITAPVPPQRLETP
jgi:Kef-type K+ transport system membrane component KefB